MLLIHSGNAQAVVIGVGGFLGIGQKDVAIPFKTLKWVSHEEAAAAAASKAPASPPLTAANPLTPCTRCGYGWSYRPGRQAGDRCQSRLPGSCGRQHDQGRTEEGTRLPLYRSFLAMNVTRTANRSDPVPFHLTLAPRYRRGFSFAVSVRLVRSTRSVASEAEPYWMALLPAADNVPEATVRSTVSRHTMTSPKEVA